VAVADLPGAAHLMLVDEVVYLEPGPAVFAAMLEGSARQQRTRGLAPSTLRGYEVSLRLFVEFVCDARRASTTPVAGR
jgi:hypothetical protein